jgi:hypothetical protein
MIVKVIAFSGRSKVGKDYIATKTKELLEAAGYEVITDSFAAGMKVELGAALKTLGIVSGAEEASFILNHPEAKELFRPLMLWLGWYRRSVSNNEYWIRNCHKRVLKNLNKLQSTPFKRKLPRIVFVLITDCRYPNEAAYIKERKLGADSWIIKVEGKVSWFQKLKYKYNIGVPEAELKIDSYPELINATIVNDGTTDQTGAITKCLKNLKILPS